MTKEKFNELIQKSRKGNKDTFIKVYNEFYPKMLYAAECVTKNIEDAKDAVQQAFAKFWQYVVISDKATIDFPDAYLYRIAKRCALEIVQSNDMYRTFDCLEVFATDESYEDRTLTKAAYKDAIQQLKEPNKTVALQFFLYNAKIKEIAEIVNEPVGTIKWRISEIKQHFKNTIK